MLQLTKITFVCLDKIITVLYGESITPYSENLY